MFSAINSALSQGYWQEATSLLKGIFSASANKVTPDNYNDDEERTRRGFSEFEVECDDDYVDAQEFSSDSDSDTDEDDICVKVTPLYNLRKIVPEELRWSQVQVLCDTSCPSQTRPRGSDHVTGQPGGSSSGQTERLPPGPSGRSWPRGTGKTRQLVTLLHDREDSDLILNKKFTKEVSMIDVRPSSLCFNSIKSYKVLADSVRFNPSVNHIAVKHDLDIEVYDLSEESVCACCHLPGNVENWTWISDHDICLVMSLDVYQWNIEDSENDVEFVFSRDHQLLSCEVVSVTADEDMRYIALTVINLELLTTKTPDNKLTSVRGTTQIYDTERGLSQCLSATALTFITYHFPWNVAPSTVMCAAGRERYYGKVYICELEPRHYRNKSLLTHIDILRLDDPCDESVFFPQVAGVVKVTKDFPVCVQCSASLGLTYVVSKYGRLYICDVETACCLYWVQISTDIILNCRINLRFGLVIVQKDGQILSMNIRKRKFIGYLHDRKKKNAIAYRLQMILFNNI